MKKFIITGAALVALAVPAVASAAPGYNPPPQASCMGQAHGTFGYLGEQGQRHDLGQGDTTDSGKLKLGADGPATGAANSSVVCPG
jgi:Spy/CpxP family protein refolding chaperone